MCQTLSAFQVNNLHWILRSRCDYPILTKGNQGPRGKGLCEWQLVGGRAGPNSSRFQALPSVIHHCSLFFFLILRTLLYLLVFIFLAPLFCSIPLRPSAIDKLSHLPEVSALGSNSSRAYNFSRALPLEELIKNASWAPLQTFWIRLLILTGPPGDQCAH